MLDATRLPYPSHCAAVTFRRTVPFTSLVSHVYMHEWKCALRTAHHRILIIHATSSSSLPSLSPHSHPGMAMSMPRQSQLQNALATPVVPVRVMHAHRQAPRIHVEVSCDPASDTPPHSLTASSRVPLSALSSPPRTVRSACLRSMGPLLHSGCRAYLHSHLLPSASRHPALTSRTQGSLRESEIGALLFVRRRGPWPPSLRMGGTERILIVEGLSAQGRAPEHGRTMSPASFTFVPQPSLKHSTFLGMSRTRLVAPRWQT
ncbi:hypothetical protein B0H19DRAFT_603017 [Mycena capillaripes]|nr:hypothetical protein B0H19DRAFT_603017 [Mycena capillaripes]